MSYKLDDLVPAKCLDPQAIFDNTSGTCTAVDTQDCDCVHLLIRFGAMDIAMTALKLQESDTLSSATALSSGTDISGADFSVSPATLPSATSDNTTLLVTVPITGSRKRYLNPVMTFGDGAAGTYCVAIWFKQLKTVPNTATLRGLAQHLVIPG